MTPPSAVPAADATPAATPAAIAITTPRLSRLFRLQWEPAQDAYVLLYPEGMVKLNQSAAEILKRCDGQRDVAAIVGDLETTFAQSGLAADVSEFLQAAQARGWVS